MISLPVYDKSGKEVGSLKVAEAAFGGRVRYALLKQAHGLRLNRRVGCVWRVRNTWLQTAT